ncbi:MAG: hypothetical protein WKG01_17560 [Kofleriaceae bacterium]
MKQFAGLALVLAACGGGGGGDDQVDAARPDVPAFTPGCEVTPQAPDSFDTPEKLGPIVKHSLAGWSADGRWFLTGTSVGGVSSFHFERRGSQVIVDRDEERPGSIDDDVIFQRYEVGERLVVKRVSNIGPDGRGRADRVTCNGNDCFHCTANLEWAERHDPAASDKLTLVGEYASPTWGPGYTFNVRVIGNLAYLIRQDGLHIIDVTDPAAPTELGSWRRTGEGYSNDVKLVSTTTKRYALIADSPVDVVDVTNPAAPQLVAQIPEEAHTVFTETRAGTTLAYFGNYNATTPVYDVTDPAQPARLGRYTSPGSFVHDLSVANGVAYLNSWDAGLEVVDFNAPATPQLLGTWDDTPTNTSHSNWTATINGRKIAVHGEESYGAHIDVVDIDPMSPNFMKPFASYKTRDHVSVHNIMVFGTKAYFTYYQDGVRVLDLANPDAPVLAGYFNTWDPQGPASSSAFFESAVGLDVDLARKLIFVADSPRGLLILRDDT